MAYGVVAGVSSQPRDFISSTRWLMHFFRSPVSMTIEFSLTFSLDFTITIVLPLSSYTVTAPSTCCSHSPLTVPVFASEYDTVPMRANASLAILTVAVRSSGLMKVSSFQLVTPVKLAQPMNAPHTMLINSRFNRCFFMLVVGLVVFAQKGRRTMPPLSSRIRLAHRRIKSANHQRPRPPPVINFKRPSESELR